MGLVSVVVTLMAWGTWLAVSQNVPMKDQQTRTFYVTLAAFVMAVLVAFRTGIEGLNLRNFWLPFVGGVVWTISALAAFIATNRLGLAKAVGIWAPMNIAVSILWGIGLFGEFLHTGVLNIVLAIASLAVIITGVLMIIVGGSGEEKAGRAAGRSLRIGVIAALSAGVGWGSYFVPIEISGMSVWVAMVPLGAGMFAGAAVMSAVRRSPLQLEMPSHYGRVLATGVLWSVGNYGALVMMERIGTGKGFTIAQLSVVVNALLGVFWEHRPMPGTRAAKITLAGVAIATIGGVVLGTLK